MQLSIGGEVVSTHATITGSAWDCHCGATIRIERLADGRVLLQHGDGEAARIFTREELPPSFLVSLSAWFTSAFWPDVMQVWLSEVHRYDQRKDYQHPLT